MTALVFPGQGSQFIGMAKDFHDEFVIAKETFEIIENSVKINLRDIIFHNKSELLNITKYTQLAIFSSSMSIFNVLKHQFNLNLNNFILRKYNYHIKCQNGKIFMKCFVKNIPFFK